MSAMHASQSRVRVIIGSLFLVFTSVTPAVVAGAAEPIDIEIQPSSGVAGDSVEMRVVLHDNGHSVAGIQIDVEAYPPLAIGITENGRPDCWRNTELNKDYTVYAFPFASEGNSAHMRALVLSLTNIDRIPDGALLFTCRIDIAVDADAGEYQLAALRLGGSTGYGEPIHAVSSGGSVVVADPVERSVALEGGAASGASGGCAIQTTDPSAVGWMLLLLALIMWWRRRGAVALQ